MRELNLEKTLTYYNANAWDFVQNTRSIEFKNIQNRFLAHLSPGGKILDFGCGSGRDTKYFLKQGYEVEAVDGSEEICRLAEAYTGIPVRRMWFLELDARNAYDGIWACASILHLKKGELPEMLKKLCRALRRNGSLYTSFKYGDYEGEREGRYFTDLTEKAARELCRNVPGLEIEECWITGDARAGRDEEQWLNLIWTKRDIDFQKQDGSFLQ